MNFIEKQRSMQNMEMQSQAQSTASIEEGQQGCIICLSVYYSPNKNNDACRRNAEEQEKLFDKILEILNVNLSPFSWNFQTEDFPFCQRCTECVKKLIWLHESLVETQIGIKKEKEDIWSKLKESELTKTSTPLDIRVVIFRGQTLKNIPATTDSPTARSTQQDDTLSTLGAEKVLEPSQPSSSINSNPNYLSAIHKEQPSSNKLSCENQNQVQYNTTPTTVSFSSSTHSTAYGSQGYYQLCGQIGNLSFPPVPVIASIVNPSIVAIPSCDSKTVTIHASEDLDANVAANVTVSEYDVDQNHNDDIDDAGCEEDENVSDYDKGFQSKVSRKERSTRKRKMSRKSSKSQKKAKRLKLKYKPRDLPNNSPPCDNDAENSGGSDYILPKEEPRIKTTKTQKRIKTSKTSRVRGGTKKQDGSRDKSKITTNVKVSPIVSTASATSFPLVTDSDGRKFIGNIELIPLEIGGFKCGKCNRAYPKDSKASRLTLREHIRGVHFDAYKCDKCEKIPKSPSDLRNHKLRVHIVGKKECDICLKPLLAENIPLHKWSHLNTDEKADAEALGLKPKPKNYVVEGGLICSYCGRTFSNRFGLQQHEQSHIIDLEERRSFSCPHCDAKFSRNHGLTRHLARNCRKVDLPKEEKTFICLMCDYKCYAKNQLARHQQTHLNVNERTVECKICARKFLCLRYLNEHTTGVHDKEGDVEEDYKFPCDFCGVRFKKRSAALLHMRKVHRENYMKDKPGVIKIIPEFPGLAEAPVGANENASRNERNEDANKMDKNAITCQKLKKTKDGQLSFRRINITSIPGGYICGQCGKQFPDSPIRTELSIKEHINGFHFGSYECPHCKIYYKSQCSLRQHMRCSHGDTSCDICGKPGLGKGTREYHFWSHKGEDEKKAILKSNEPWKIPFFVRQDLGMKGIASFRCSKCTEIFPTVSARRDHLLKEHQQWVRIQRKPCPKSMRGKEDDLDSESESEELSFSEISEGDESSDFRGNPRSRQYSKIKTKSESRKSTSHVENIQTSVSLIRLPNKVLGGTNFKVLKDNRLAFISSCGVNNQLSLMELDVGLTVEDLRKAHFEMQLPSSDDDSNSSYNESGHANS